MNKQATQLIVRGGINKIGNMLYDYGNSVWLASLGSLGQAVLGIYQISETLTSIFVNPFGGVVSDRFSRRKILLVTDMVCAILCLGVSFLSDQLWMIAGLILANIVQSIAFAFSRPANKAYITEIVAKDDMIKYNARLELVLQVISVSAPVLSFLVLHVATLQVTLQLDALSFFIAFLLVWFLPKDERKVKVDQKWTLKAVFQDIGEGLVYIWRQREIFILLVMASLVNFFFAAFNYLLPFSNNIYHQDGAYATILTLGAVGAIIGALLAGKLKNTMKNLLLTLAMTGLGVILMGIPYLSVFLAYGGNFVCELFMTIFNIHFFTQVQTKVEGAYLGRVLSTIYTLAILFMPVGTLLMTVLPSIQLASFIVIGLGVFSLSVLSHLMLHKHPMVN